MAFFNDPTLYTIASTRQYQAFNSAVKGESFNSTSSNYVEADSNGTSVSNGSTGGSTQAVGGEFISVFADETAAGSSIRRAGSTFYTVQAVDRYSQGFTFTESQHLRVTDTNNSTVYTDFFGTTQSSFGRTINTTLAQSGVLSQGNTSSGFSYSEVAGANSTVTDNPTATYIVTWRSTVITGTGTGTGTAAPSSTFSGTYLATPNINSYYQGSTTAISFSDSVSTSTATTGTAGSTTTTTSSSFAFARYAVSRMSTFEYDVDTTTTQTTSYLTRTNGSVTRTTSLTTVATLRSSTYEDLAVTTGDPKPIAALNIGWYSVGVIPVSVYNVSYQPGDGAIGWNNTGGQDGDIHALQDIANSHVVAFSAQESFQSSITPNAVVDENGSFVTYVPIQVSDDTTQHVFQDISISFGITVVADDGNISNKTRTVGTQFSTTTEGTIIYSVGKTFLPPIGGTDSTNVSSDWATTTQGMPLTLNDTTLVFLPVRDASGQIVSLAESTVQTFRAITINATVPVANVAFSGSSAGSGFTEVTTVAQGAVEDVSISTLAGLSVDGNVPTLLQPQNAPGVALPFKAVYSRFPVRSIIAGSMDFPWPYVEGQGEVQVPLPKPSSYWTTQDVSSMTTQVVIGAFTLDTTTKNSRQYSYTLSQKSDSLTLYEWQLTLGATSTTRTSYTAVFSTFTPEQTLGYQQAGALTNGAYPLGGFGVNTTPILAAWTPAAVVLIKVGNSTSNDLTATTLGVSSSQYTGSDYTAVGTLPGYRLWAGLGLPNVTVTPKFG